MALTVWLGAGQCVVGERVLDQDIETVNTLFETFRTFFKKVLRASQRASKPRKTGLFTLVLD
ncbi:conserved hypothetical protein [Ahrensia sp. R2A130]|nr:conserved hypothetical protein [Ahrensia sp. R2A130]